MRIVYKCTVIINGVQSYAVSNFDALKAEYHQISDFESPTDTLPAYILDTLI